MNAQGLTTSAGPGAGGTGGASNADTGSLINSSSSSTDKSMTWVSRSYTDASAMRIYQTFDGLLVANIRTYNRSGANFVGKTTTITYDDPNVTPTVRVVAPVEVVKVELKEVKETTAPYRLLHYNLMYYPLGFDSSEIPQGNPVRIGKVRFNRGVNGRNSSDVSLKFGPPVKPNPCDEPPLDDIGEEEEVAFVVNNGTSDPNVPGTSLPLMASSQSE
jgi:hypothetical protein